MKKIYLFALVAFLAAAPGVYAGNANDAASDVNQPGSIPASIVKDAEDINTIFTAINSVWNSIKAPLEISLIPSVAINNVLGIIRGIASLPTSSIRL